VPPARVWVYRGQEPAAALAAKATIANASA
jgi:hypothetical protein